MSPITRANERYRVLIGEVRPEIDGGRFAIKRTLGERVNLDPGHTQAGRLRLPLENLGIGTDRPYQAHDLLSDAHYLWHGVRNYIGLNSSIVPAHIFRSEQNFDYFMEAT